MPLQHTHEHEETPAPLSAFSTNAPQETVPASPANEVSNAPRYDAAAVKQIIALAEQMQAHHRQTLTPVEIEALGNEVGVEPQFIQRALAQINTPATAASIRQANPRAKQNSQSTVTELPVQVLPFTLTQKQARLLTVPLALYLAVLPYTLGLFDLRDRQILAPILLYLIVPAVLALYLGGKGKSTRFGMLAGALMGLPP